MAEFDSWDAYRTFAQSVKHRARYVFDDTVDKFLRTVLATSDSRRTTLASGRFLWRAQQGDHWETICVEGEQLDNHGPLPPAGMKPLPRSAREGRVNPKGIPCLYLASDKDTAMAEVRPWIGSYISVGQFKTLKELMLVNCSVEHGSDILHHIYLEEPNSTVREKAVWAYIDHAFSEPVTQDESSAGYAPTQILAEAFRSHGYDGVVYKSLLGKGFNVALFDINAADLVNCFLYEAKSVTFRFDEVENPYFVGKHVEGKKKDDAQPGASGDAPKAARS